MFKPSWEYASKFIQQLNNLISPVYEIDTRTLHNNLAFSTAQTLFSFLMNVAIHPSFSLHAGKTIINLAINSINSNQGKQESFIERFSPAMFKFIDTIANKGDALSFEATYKLIQFFPMYMCSTNYFWPWSKWWA